MLTQRQYFKAAVLEDWTAQGLTPDQCLRAAQQMRKRAGFMDAVGPVVGSAIGSGAGAAVRSGESLLGSLVGASPALLALGLAAPPAIGAGVGYAAAQMPSAVDETPEDVQSNEMIDEYRRLAERARYNKIMKIYRLAKSRKPRGRPLM